MTISVVRRIRSMPGGIRQPAHQEKPRSPMHLDPNANSLTFDDRGELAAFHAELSALVREVTIAAASSSADPEEGAKRAGAILEQFATVMAALNAVRASGVIERSGP
jgi:hypothetical protein